MNKFYILLFSFFFAVTSFSQINVSVRAGANIATTKNLIAFPKNRLGWFGGFSSSVSLSEKFFLQPELIYSSKGDRTDNQGGTSNVSLRLNYVNVPILAGYTFDNRTSIVLGPEFGYLVAARLIIGNNNLDVIKKHPTRFDIGTSIGLHYNLKSRIKSEIRYNYGFNTLYSIDAAGNRYTERNGANRVFQIGIRYLIIP